MSQNLHPVSSVESDLQSPTIKRLRQLGWLLDNVITIPGTKIGIGVDPILGLIPMGGDFVGVMLSCYIVLEAARLGAPKATIGKMVLNIIIDGLVGSVPVMGDLFDFAWKANTTNIKLLEDYLKFPRQTKRTDKWFIFGLLVVLLFLAVVLVAIPVILIRLLWQTLVGP